MSHDFTLAPAKAKTCPPAAAPIVFQYDVTHIETEGTAPVIAADLAVGDSAYYGGKIANNGCVPITITVSYLDGADCDTCSPDTLALVDIDLIIPANASYTIPDGYWQDLTYVVDGGAGVPIGVTQNVHIFSACPGDPCPECVVVAI